MGGNRKAAKVAHATGPRQERTRERVLLYRDGKLRFVWRDLDR